ncbi:DUF4136 domain-containing protein [Hydrogenophaga pseudoflava]|uniref:DUF4136 domain-containing protein n=1 Tax=Hydrogenophaga pseudoflava TaxID=47421 RepID=A0A4P6X0R6_HYDPS|nr:DUF4136 domain-containing protein [Hydrogenophaga pseudoflava]QBM30132.1 hypothetical protein HPF_20735 [Hydrogenophaga pseudoflava]
MTRLALALLTTLALAGCAGTYRVDNAVQSYAHWSADIPTGAQAPAAVPQAPQTYRFERLPSQRERGSAEDQNRLEAWTRTVLETHGWTVAEAPANAPWRVQVTATTVRNARSPWDDPWPSWRFRGQVVAGNGYFYWSPMFVVPMDMPWYERKVTVVIRDAASGRVVYETQAGHDGRWNSTPALWQAMLQAALNGFPAPPSGPRQVDIDLPR